MLYRIKYKEDGLIIKENITMKMLKEQLEGLDPDKVIVEYSDAKGIEEQVWLPYKIKK